MSRGEGVVKLRVTGPARIKAATCVDTTTKSLHIDYALDRLADGVQA